MSKIEKLITRFKSNPRDFTWNELVRFMDYFGYNEGNSGKTSGSAVKLYHNTRQPIYIHKPHPAKILKAYAMKEIKEKLKKEGLI